VRCFRLEFGPDTVVFGIFSTPSRKTPEYVRLPV